MLARAISDPTAYVEELEASPVVEDADFKTRSKALALQSRMTTTNDLQSVDPYGAATISHW